MQNYSTLEVDEFGTYVGNKQKKHWLIYANDLETKEIAAYKSYWNLVLNLAVCVQTVGRVLLLLSEMTIML